MLIRPFHRESTLSGIFLKLKNIKYLYRCKFKLDERSSYLRTFSHQFGKYRYKRFQFGAAPAGEICFNKKSIKYLKIYQM